MWVIGEMGREEDIRMVRKVIIPAADLGTRLFPATKRYPHLSNHFRDSGNWMVCFFAKNLSYPSGFDFFDLFDVFVVGEDKV